jgi:hypothetical protein
VRCPKLSEVAVVPDIVKPGCVKLTCFFLEQALDSVSVSIKRQNGHGLGDGWKHITITIVLGEKRGDALR